MKTKAKKTKDPKNPPQTSGLSLSQDTTTDNKSLKFAHLHVHTHYSLLKSSCTVSSLVDKCVEYKQPAVAITDYGNMFGALDLYFKAKEKGIQPILGLEIYLIPNSSNHNKHYSSANAFHADSPSLVLLAQNKKGYQNLCHINTIACQEDFYYVPRAKWDTLKKYSSSLIALTGGVNGAVKQTFIKKGPEQALQLIKKLKSIYGEGLYLQLNRMGLPEEETFNQFSCICWQNHPHTSYGRK